MSTTRHNTSPPRRAVVPRRVRFLEIEGVVVACTVFGAMVFVDWAFFPVWDPRNGLARYMLLAYFVYTLPRMMIHWFRTRRKLNRHDWLLCPRCEHDLRGLETDPLICPECGREWTVEQVRRSWEKWLT